MSGAFSRPSWALDLILANFPPVILTHIVKDKNGGMSEEGNLRIFKNHSCEEAEPTVCLIFLVKLGTGVKMSPRYTAS